MEGLSKTPDEIKKGLECCAASKCIVCPYKDWNGCTTRKNTDALAYIHQLERERDAAADLYKPHSNCESCKHNGSKLCDNCTNKNNCWEWAGIKEDNP